MSEVIHAVRFRIAGNIDWSTPIAFFLNYNKAIEYVRWEENRNDGLPFVTEWDTMEYPLVQFTSSNDTPVIREVREVQFVEGGSLRLEPDAVATTEQRDAVESGTERHVAPTGIGEGKLNNYMSLIGRTAIHLSLMDEEEREKLGYGK